MEVEKERAERRKVRRRTKGAASTSASTSAPAPAAPASVDVEMADSSTAVVTAGATGEGEGKGKGKEEGGELEEESVYREKELNNLNELVDAELKTDLGCSVSGLYELVGEFLLVDSHSYSSLQCFPHD